MNDEESGGTESNAATHQNPGWITRCIRALKRRREERRTHKEHENAVDRAARSSARATWIIAGLTLVTVGVTVSTYFILEGQLTEMQNARAGSDQTTADQLAQMKAQTLAMQGQLTQMQAASEQTERAIAATNRLAEESAKSTTELHRLADAAIQANELVKQGLTSVQSAFMSVERINLDPANLMGKPGFDWNAEIIWENNGNTPTKDLLIDMHCVASPVQLIDPSLVTLTAQTALVQGSFDGPYTYDPKVLHLTFGPRQIGPGGACSLNSMAARLEEFGSHHIVYAIGRAQYRDIFNKLAIHVTKFCFEINNIGVVGKDESTRMSASITRCETNNCADAECNKNARTQATKGLTSSDIPRKPR